MSSFAVPYLEIRQGRGQASRGCHFQISNNIKCVCIMGVESGGGGGRGDASSAVEKSAGDVPQIL